MEPVKSRNLVSPDGTPITERDVQRGLRVSITASCIGMLWVVTALGIPLTLMLQSLGASGLLIGIATTIQQLAMVAQIPASYLTERFSHRKTFWAITCLAHRAVWFVPAFLPLVIPNNWSLMAKLIVLTVAVSSILAQASTPAWFSWMVDLIPENMSARFWSRRQSLVMAVYLVFTIAVGYILDVFPDPQSKGGSFLGYVIVFTGGALLGLGDILVHMRVPEPKPHPAKTDEPLWQRILAPLYMADFRWLSFSMGVWNFMMGMIGSFSIVALKRDFHFSYLQITLVTVSGSIGAILSGLQTAYLIDRLGARTYAAMLMLLAPLTALPWFFMLDDTQVSFTLPLAGLVSISQPLLLQLIASCIAGAMFSSIVLCQIRLLSSLSPTEGRTMAMGAHWTVVGLMAALGPMLGGGIMDYFDKHPIDWVMFTGTRFSFFHVLVILLMGLSWVLATPFILQVSRSKGDLPIGEALPRLWLGNPLRAVRNVYNLYAANAVVSATERKRAVSDLGTSRVRLAVADLIANLDDPSYDVREAAATALGNIDSPEAVSALVARLDSPDSDLDLQIIRSLRNKQSPAAMAALLRQLYSTNYEIQAEAARALGFHRNPEAIEPLLDQLNRTTDDKVLLATVEALAKLKEIQLLPAVLKRLDNHPSPLLRKSLLVEIGDVLGEPGRFYKILGQYREDPHHIIEERLDALEQIDGFKKELTRRFQQMFDSGDTEGCLRAIMVIAETCPPTTPVTAVIAALRQRGEKPQTEEILLVLYLLAAVKK